MVQWKLFMWGPLFHFSPIPSSPPYTSSFFSPFSLFLKNSLFQVSVPYSVSACFIICTPLPMLILCICFSLFLFYFILFYFSLFLFCPPSSFLSSFIFHWHPPSEYSPLLFFPFNPLHCVDLCKASGSLSCFFLLPFPYSPFHFIIISSSLSLFYFYPCSYLIIFSIFFSLAHFPSFHFFIFTSWHPHCI
jgi:hypothetical protein